MHINVYGGAVECYSDNDVSRHHKEPIVAVMCTFRVGHVPHFNEALTGSVLADTNLKLTDI